VTDKDIGQDVQIQLANGGFMQRNFVATLLLWYIFVADLLSKMC
jgi:hypothetical protein